MLGPLSGALFGTLLGMRHALEPDHLAAVGTLAAERRGGRAGFFIGASWGLGHALTLVLVGGGLSLLKARVPAPLEQGFEALVALMVVGLGVQAVRRALALGAAGPRVVHAHGEAVHVHPGAIPHLHLWGVTLATRPLLVGVVHGLAGSGALTALVLSELPSVKAQLLYVCLFALGSVLGMGLLTALAGAGLQLAAPGPRTERGLLLGAGLLSVGVGTWWGAVSALSLLG